MQSRDTIPAQPMYLLDRNADPKNTVYFISSCVLHALLESDGLDISELNRKISTELNLSVRKQKFILLALDFLFLLGKIGCDSEGIIHANQIDRDS